MHTELFARISYEIEHEKEEQRRQSKIIAKKPGQASTIRSGCFTELETWRKRKVVSEY